ncbi:MAG TPA: ATP synthase subunit I [Streptosporangiaceae bacterium]
MAADVTLGGVTRGYRRVLIVAAALGIVGLIVTVLLGHYMAGVTLCVGIALGFINARLTVSAAARFSRAKSRAKRPIIFGSLQRLGAITAVALLVAYWFRPDGLAVLAGIALFHILLLGNTSTALLGELRRTKQ